MFETGDSRDELAWREDNDPKPTARLFLNAGAALGIRQPGLATSSVSATVFERALQAV